MRQLSIDEMQKMLKNHEPLFLVDDVEEMAYDFTKYPLLRVKHKGHKPFERMEAHTNSETDAFNAGWSITEEEFEKY